MRRLSPGRLACSLLVGVLGFSFPQATQAADTERVKFDTFDQVELHGTFYASSKGNKAPCVMLLHNVGGNSQQEGWDDLAKKLQAQGFAVLAFDFRGHGDSTTVGPGFWLDRANQALKSFRPGKPKDSISYRDFSTIYNYLYLVNDIAAAKRYLDKRNDAGDCNSSNVTVIGAEAGAALGALWIFTEWHRQKVSVGPILVTPMRGQMEGLDIASAVWLSISPTISTGSSSKFQLSVQSWLGNPVREKVPMGFLYGEQDARAAKYARYLCDNVIRPTKKMLTAKSAIAGTKLSGADLLGKGSLDTTEKILRYLTRVVEERPMNPWSKREVDRKILYRVPVERFAR